MGILDQVTQMKSQGKSEGEIIKDLQDQGISSKDIQDAMSQAQVKNAVSGPSTQDMQQSIMENPPINPAMTQEATQEYAPAPQAPANQYPAPYAPQTQEVGAYAQDPYAGGEYYADEGAGYNYSPATSDTGTLIDIAEQIFMDKIKNTQKTINSLNEFKALTSTKIKGFEERLKRIESTIDQLQISILEKIGSYGTNLNSIKKEMTMMQDSFGKVINPVLDKKSKKKT